MHYPRVRRGLANASPKEQTGDEGRDAATGHAPGSDAKHHAEGTAENVKRKAGDAGAEAQRMGCNPSQRGTPPAGPALRPQPFWQAQF